MSFNPEITKKMNKKKLFAGVVLSVVIVLFSGAAKAFTGAYAYVDPEGFYEEYFAYANWSIYDGGIEYGITYTVCYNSTGMSIVDADWGLSWTSTTYGNDGVGDVWSGTSGLEIGPYAWESADYQYVYSQITVLTWLQGQCYAELH